jgi:hypothetical protein
MRAGSRRPRKTSARRATPTRIAARRAVSGAAYAAAPALAPAAVTISFITTSGCDTIEGVGGRDLLDRRLRPLSHKALRRRRDRLVLGAEQIPRWDRLLRRGSRRRGERRGAPRAQCGRHYPRGVGVDVTGEGGGKRALVEIQIHAVRAVRVRNWHFPQRGRNEAALVQLKELTDALSFVQSPPWDPLPVLSMFSPCVGLACPVGQPIPVRGDRSAFLAHAVAQ